jgi:5-methylcytosine-specific restriction endonuclease McrA
MSPRIIRGSYRDFLKSPYWYALRRQVIALYPYCERCGCGNNLQVHHQRYDFLGMREEYYKYWNLELLCRTCHAAHHGLPAEVRDHSGPELLSDIMRRMGFKDAA